VAAASAVPGADVAAASAVPGADVTAASAFPGADVTAVSQVPCRYDLFLLGFAPQLWGLESGGYKSWDFVDIRSGRLRSVGVGLGVTDKSARWNDRSPRRVDCAQLGRAQCGVEQEEQPRP